MNATSRRRGATPNELNDLRDIVKGRGRGRGGGLHLQMAELRQQRQRGARGRGAGRGRRGHEAITDAPLVLEDSDAEPYPVGVDEIPQEGGGVFQELDQEAQLEVVEALVEPAAESNVHGLPGNGDDGQREHGAECPAAGAEAIAALELLGDDDHGVGNGPAAGDVRGGPYYSAPNAPGSSSSSSAPAAIAASPPAPPIPAERRIRGPSQLGYFYDVARCRHVCRISNTFSNSVKISCYLHEKCKVTLPEWRLPSRRHLQLWAASVDTAAETSAAEATRAQRHMGHLQELIAAAERPGRTRQSLIDEAAAAAENP